MSHLFFDKNHPNPRLQRKKFLLLDGTFNYEIKDDAKIYETLEKEIDVPNSIKEELLPSKYLHLKRTFTIDEQFFSEEEITLHLLKVDQLAKVYLNGVLAMETALPLLEVKANVKNYLKVGENEIYFIIRDDNLTSVYAKGKQNYDGLKKNIPPLSGLLDSLYLEAHPSIHLLDYHLDYDRLNHRLKVELLPKGLKEKKVIEIYDNNNLKIIEEFHSDEIEIDVSSLEEYSYLHPKIYDVNIRVGEDEVRSYFGLRKLEIKYDEDNFPLLLENGRIIFLKGFIDFGYFFKSSIVYEDIDRLYSYYKTLKDNGFHLIYFEDVLPSYKVLSLLDRLGIYYLLAIISSGSEKKLWVKFMEFTSDETYLVDRSLRLGRNKKESYSQLKLELVNNIDAHLNFTGLLAYVLFNEGVGQINSKALTRYVKETYPHLLIISAFNRYDLGVGDIFARAPRSHLNRIRNDKMRLLLLSLHKMKLNDKLAKQIDKLIVEERLSILLYSYLWNYKKIRGVFLEFDGEEDELDKIKEFDELLNWEALKSCKIS